jgi:hypothetical protein
MSRAQWPRLLPRCCRVEADPSSNSFLNQISRCIRDSCVPVQCLSAWKPCRVVHDLHRKAEGRRRTSQDGFGVVGDFPKNCDYDLPCATFLHPPLSMGFPHGKDLPLTTNNSVSPYCPPGSRFPSPLRFEISICQLDAAHGGHVPCRARMHGPRNSGSENGPLHKEKNRCKDRRAPSVQSSSSPLCWCCSCRIPPLHKAKLSINLLKMSVQANRYISM